MKMWLNNQKLPVTPHETECAGHSTQRVLTHPSVHSRPLFGHSICAHRILQTRCCASESWTGGDKGGQVHQRAFKLIVSTSGRKLTYLKLSGERPQRQLSSTVPYIIDLMGVNGLVSSKLFSQHRCLPFDKLLWSFMLLIIFNSENVIRIVWNVVYNGPRYCWLPPLNFCKAASKSLVQACKKEMRLI